MGNSSRNSVIYACPSPPGQTETDAAVPAALLGLFLLMSGCTSGPQAGVPGPYTSWDDVINKWLGAKKVDLYYELGPPNLHPHELDNGMTEMVWDLSIDRMPGQADEYGTLPLNRAYGCRLMFFADAEGIVQSGRHSGCD